ncbi:phage repressor protein [Haloferax sp. Atlit-19N]|uniref:winged-helix domain-containing protein n=1 Tax=Haloferax sp. Atlit-19N TaxID=2077201 RepID=UPI000E2612EF|nr:winged-helix domain-containing protein [Haloferax sp. Atlit-19N]RDZ48625.1 phage repressor protein [Haloferax sp. Atlit-19N]
MSLKDGLLLEFLAEHNLELPPKPLYRNLNRHGHKIGYSTVRLRLSELEKHGLVSEVGSGGYYEISEVGQQYLQGEVALEELED